MSVFHRLHTRIAVFFVVLMLSVLGAALVIVGRASEGIVHRQLSEELLVGERVLRGAIAQRTSQLSDAARVLAADFGFREAVATQDIQTIDSVLENHGKRINASFVVLSDLELNQLADSRSTSHGTARVPFGLLVPEAQRNGIASGIVLIGSVPYQIVVLPVRAPLPIAWVAMGFAIDDGLVKELRDVIGGEVSILIRGSSARWSLQASTLPPERRADLPARFDNIKPQEANATLVLAGEPFQTRSAPLSLDGRGSVTAVLQRSLEDGIKSFSRLRNLLVMVGLAGLVLMIIGSFLIARGIARPVRDLAATARRVRDGDYALRTDATQAGEIGELAESFNLMITGLAEREERISHLAYQDGLTGLPNRVQFKQRLRALMADAPANGRAVSVLMLDLDRFRYINDTLGQPMGDDILRQVGARLTSVISSGDMVARLGGDEFAVLLSSASVDEASMLAQRVLKVLETPVSLDTQIVDVASSIGIATCPVHSTDAVTLTRQAEMAMYVAKRNHAGVAIYDAAQEEGRQGHLSLLGELRRAIDADELTLYYQPKMELRTGQVGAAEALVRWIHPQRGFISPADFIPFAEHTGYIKHVTRWVLERALRQIRQWQQEGVEIKVSVNVSTRDLVVAAFADQIADMLSQYEVPARLLCLEITESGVMEDPVRALDTLQRLHGLGLRLSVDDYGTGYSSLSYLKQLPVQELKIDRSFVVGLTESDDDAMIVHSTIELGHNMGLEVVAEGVETQAGLEMLAKLGCDMAQGYFVSKPIPAEQFIRWLRERSEGCIHPAASIV